MSLVKFLLEIVLRNPKTSKNPKNERNQHFIGRVLNHSTFLLIDREKDNQSVKDCDPVREWLKSPWAVDDYNIDS